MKADGELSPVARCYGVNFRAEKYVAGAGALVRKSNNGVVGFVGTRLVKDVVLFQSSTSTLLILQWWPSVTGLSTCSFQSLQMTRWWPSPTTTSQRF